MIRLGLRLGVTSSLRTAIPAVVTMLSTAIGTLLMLLVMCVAPAMQARADRSAWMDEPSWATASSAGVESGAPVTYLLQSVDYLGADSITVVDLAGSGAGAPVPPNMSALPEPGSVLLSPALARLLGKWPEAAGRYGTVAGRLNDGSLEGPDSLVAVRGLSLDQGRLVGQPVAAFPKSGHVLELQGLLQVLMVVGSIAMLAPVLLLVVIGTRLSIRSREARLSALRLVGATRTQISQLAAVEALVPSLTGVLLGFGLWFLLRPVAAYINYDSGRWFTADLVPNPLGTVIVLVGVPVVAMIATLTTLSRVQRNPLGTRRRSHSGFRPKRRAVPLALAMVALVSVVAVPQVGSVVGSPDRAAAAVFGVLMVALMLAGPFLAMGVGHALVRSGTVAGLLAGRRILDEPVVAFRAVSGVVLAVLVTSLFIVTTPAAAETLDNTRGSGQNAGTAQATVFYASPDQSAQLRERLLEIPGISNVTPVYEGTFQMTGQAVRAWIGDCGQIARATQLPSIPCGSAPLIATEAVVSQLAMPGAAPARLYGLSSAQVTALTAGPPQGFVSEVQIPTNPVAVMAPPGGMDMPSLIIAPSALVSTVVTLRPTLLLLRYSDNHALEQARSQVFNIIPGSYVSTRQSVYDGYSRDVRRLYRIVLFATGGVFALASFGLAISVIIGLVERRRPFALLRASGAALSILRRAMVYEVVAPMVSAAALAGISGALMGIWLTASSGSGATMDWAALVVPVAAGITLCLCMALCTVPFVGKITDGQATRTE